MTREEGKKFWLKVKALLSDAPNKDDYYKKHIWELIDKDIKPDITELYYWIEDAVEFLKKLNALSNQFIILELLGVKINE